MAHTRASVISQYNFVMATKKRLVQINFAVTYRRLQKNFHVPMVLAHLAHLRFDSITPLFCDLFLVVSTTQRVEYKLSVLVYRWLHNLAPECLCDELRRVADISSRQRLRSSSTYLIVPPTQRFLLLLHASGTVCHFSSLQHHLYRLREEAEAVFVQPQFPVLICCSYSCDFVFDPAAFGLNALFVN